MKTDSRHFKRTGASARETSHPLSYNNKKQQERKAIATVYQDQEGGEKPKEL